ncbi:hypothetical protein COT76_00180 [Candidatus Berkelbacteria bacterium CG10_big_fil_rev_8_21_14_0_10_33_10]|uniref:DegT/DnrJ/EryC1/StrS aminotransferase family protein n=1 Tax=Candidatus Berkelbacteria bacterium CG_4_10_14_0_2_um_filter_35_9_33_12 TaxID=1974499 RepID=A0A2M7W3G3_9BACT|nr:MAG: hypothetical protein COT76_00180 [Candidatus Berkelbacteria bacterium CG10_big_fil_rev_8_21_14_0_10_33_10]PJA19998.1 MAG: hypothetical protein COX60_03140 [Candidatus Berkelbacteria bacterium CG_4_10_14_0_2_um_filter_35_9_33_12]
MVLQPWGNIANLDKIGEIRKKYNIFFISDSSHAHESTWNGQGIGKYFDISCASFGLGKLISGGELGVLTTDSSLFRDRALLFSYTNRVPWDLLTNEYKNIDNNVGIKFRPHLFSLLLALNDLLVNKSHRFKTRENILKFQKEMIKNTGKVSFQKNYKKANRVFHMPLIEFQKEIDINDLIITLKNNGFHAQTHNYKTILSRNSITTEFYKIRTNRKFPVAQEVVSKNIIQFYFSDFSSQDKISKLKKIILKYLSKY